MKRVGLSITMLLTCIVFLTAPVGSYASDEGSTVESMTKTVSVWERYPLGTIPPSIYIYDRLGWKGTLKLVDYQTAPDFVIANYKGTVTCHGTCAVGEPGDQEKE
ncbi:hypothetical protein JNUCC1_02544 [Lentibacillus sp. JNUCC-1]|uniref:hypothetical protein n=1 Tax=Lentibacillus sp. JNUCC-1 TaxID=2654513 RepID=UPI0012E7004E|nr:hypothetical protein [Lentibacillus sp. JNUCC-1]MUV38690.1 hypothetical protein [Lentibacillus sp. JNUCC-1]